MDFIQSANKQVDKFGSGKHGFSAGNPSGGIPATYLSPAWCDNIQQEIVNVIEGAGLSINPAAQNQLFSAIQSLIGAGANNDYKASVRVATTSAINLASPGAAIDGVTMAPGNRFLDKDNATQSSRGIYIWNGAAVAATRATDADGAGELTSGMIVAVEEGTTNADSAWMLTTDGTITIGTTGLTFRRMGSGLALLAASGWQKLESGLILQWGYQSSQTNSTTVSFPITFPNAVFVVVPGDGNSAPASATNAHIIGVNPTILSTSGFGVAVVRYDGDLSGSSSMFWFAIGW